MLTPLLYQFRNQGVAPDKRSPEAHTAAGTSGGSLSSKECDDDVTQLSTAYDEANPTYQGNVIKRMQRARTIGQLNEAFDRTGASEEELAELQAIFDEKSAQILG